MRTPEQSVTITLPPRATLYSAARAIDDRAERSHAGFAGELRQASDLLRAVADDVAHPALSRDVQMVGR